MQDSSGFFSGRARQAFGIAGLAASVLRRTAFRKFPETPLRKRLEALPDTVPTLGRPLTIRWNEQHVPFVEAGDMRDAAIGLGLVHGHLRLAQIELMRRAATGRLAEVAGGAAVELDALLRLIDFPRATSASLAMMPGETRAWIDGFAEGISAAALSGPVAPELDVFGIAPRPINAEELFAISRLCSADYAWKVWRTLNKLREEEDWAEMWADLVGVAAIADEDIPIGAEQLEDAVPTAFARTGSNAWALAGSRTGTGHPLLACDPHLVIATPSPWMIAGFKVPDLSVWGLMIPALPIFGAARNGHGAWGGTNLHAQSSELVDVTATGEDDDEPIETETVKIKVRGGRPVERTLRQTRLGPVISDAKPFAMPAETVALHWLGHRPSDEYTPFLKLMRSRDWKTFEAAVDGYALPGLNMIWAGKDGSIGKMIGAHIPRRPLATPKDMLTTREDAETHWDELLTGKDLPQIVDPPEGYVTSANEAPKDPPVTISLFFSAPTRTERLAELFGDRTDFTLDDFRLFHRDVFLRPALDVARKLAPIAQEERPDAQVTEALAAWDGHYERTSAGALAFELIASALIDALEERLTIRKATPYWRPFVRLENLVLAADDETLAETIAVAVDSAEPVFGERRQWGALHRLRLGHPFSRLPWLSGRLPTIDLPSGGSNDTLMKSMHPFTQKQHATGFGANARFLADLSDEDETYAVLLGGQDGWPGSDTMFDMVGPWRRGEYVRLPFSEDKLADEFPVVTAFAPKAGPQPAETNGKGRDA